MRAILRTLALIALLPALLSPAIAQVRYEVASIHPSRPGASPQSARVAFLADGFDADDSTIGDILDMLNNWQLNRVVGGPAWLTTDRYDIHAKAEAPVPPEQQHDALMALLADRFKLTVHKETRDLSAIVLLAPRMPAALKPAAPGETYRFPYNVGNPLNFTAVPMSSLTNYLSNVWSAPVIDQTGLAGAFDFTLNLSTDAGESWADRVREALLAAGFKEALLAAGFKVENRKVPTEITVIDHLDRPSEN